MLAVPVVESSDPRFRRYTPTACDNSCEYAGDGQCDDGGLGSAHPFCQLGTDCDDCGVRTVARLPVRELGYQEFTNHAPSIGLGEAGATIFIERISFEDCAARCDDDCVGIVRRNTGSNCWLVPAASYPGGDLASNLNTWSGGTTYAKLPTCENDPVEELLDLSRGSGGRTGESVYTVAGVATVTSTDAVYPNCDEANPGPTIKPEQPCF